ncbi:MAG: DUF61 family protein [Methanomassiliicoccales archaeon]|jgi:uncharacterized protein (UPF0216 family)
MFDDKTLERLVVHMNRHVPSTRRRLSEMHLEKEPVYVGRDGTAYHVSHEELEVLASHLDEFDRSALKIPILIITDTSYPGGAWKVMGKVEAKVISLMIGKEMESTDEIRLFHPHVHELRRILPTATTVLYMP